MNTPETWKRPIRPATSRYLEAAGDSLTDGAAGPHPRTRGLPDQALAGV